MSAAGRGRGGRWRWVGRERREERDRRVLRGEDVAVVKGEQDVTYEKIEQEGEEGRKQKSLFCW